MFDILFDNYFLQERYNKYVIMAKKKTGDLLNDISGQSALKFILTFLFGYVLTEYLNSYHKILISIQRILNIDNYGKEILFLNISLIVFGINIFRMLHGYVRLLFTEDDLEDFGGTVGNLTELIWSITLLISPLATIRLLTMEHVLKENGSLHTLYGFIKINPPFIFVIVAFTIPTLVYLFYDIIAFDYFKKRSDSIKGSSVFLSHILCWIVLDSLIVISAIFAILVGENNSLNLLIYSLIVFGIIIADYILNKKYYF